MASSPAIFNCGKLLQPALAAMVARRARRGQARGSGITQIISRKSVLAEKLQGQPDALVRLLDLKQMPGAFDEAVVVAALNAERLVGRASRRRAFKVGIAADELDRPAELRRLRPQVERQRLRVDRGFILGRTNE